MNTVRLDETHYPLVRKVEKRPITSNEEYKQQAVGTDVLFSINFQSYWALHHIFTQFARTMYVVALSS